MQRTVSIFWKKSPFVKFLLALITGILLQWYLQPGKTCWLPIFVVGFCILPVFFFVPFFTRYRLAFVSGIITTIVFISIGGLLVHQQDIRNSKNWFNLYYKESTGIIATVDEPLSEKANSFKARANASYIISNEKKIPVKGKIIIYFSKDSTHVINYGSQVIFFKPLQEIKNTGNPGSFDYKRYCLFNSITHQVYLEKKDFQLLAEAGSAFRKFIYDSRETILDILRKNISGEKELGLAEALLIGYKDDLDKTLVQSYSNTGVVHIIAISGLHLGLIYLLLSFATKPLLQKKKIRWLRPLLIISSLWLFSILAGAQPSILRSAIMFTCIVLGEYLDKKGSVFNTIAVSAFLILCINPFWLWDLGFQLSYAAVISIIVFMNPIYHLFYIKNKALDFIWKMNAVTIAAQLLTIPMCIYQFHQFPNLFLLSNFIAVPLSSAILLGEIFLCLVSFLPILPEWTGKLLEMLIRGMNTYIEKIDSIPFSVSDGFQISLLQAILLYIFIVSICYWLMEKNGIALKWGLIALSGFILLRCGSFLEAKQQEKIIIYNIPKKSAVDVINGRKYSFIGDSLIAHDQSIQNFHLKPSRILHRLGNPEKIIDPGDIIDFGDKYILFLNTNLEHDPEITKIPVHILILSGKLKTDLGELVKIFEIKQLVADGSVPSWKVRQLKTSAGFFGIPFHDVGSSGAFVMNLR